MVEQTNTIVLLHKLVEENFINIITFANLQSNNMSLLKYF
jgi:hypothetical protein